MTMGNKRPYEHSRTEHLLQEYRFSSDGNREELRREIAWINKGLVCKLADKVIGRLNAAREDLKAVGFIGLLRAIDDYDASKGKFSNFASEKILGEMQHYARDSAPIPRKAYELLPKYKNARRELGIRLSRTPTMEEIGLYLRIPEEEVEYLQNAAILADQVILMSPTLLEEVDLKPIEGNTGDANGLELRIDVEMAMQALPEREKMAVHLYYFGGKTLEEIGKEFRCSAMHASRILSKAKKTLFKILGDYAPSNAE